MLKALNRVNKEGRMPIQALEAKLNRALKQLFIATSLLYLFMLGLLVAGIVSIAEQRSAIKRESARSTVALCSLRKDLEVRIDSSEKFLRDHPRGIPGITPALIKDGINNQKRTINALRVLNCK